MTGQFDLISYRCVPKMELPSGGQPIDRWRIKEEEEALEQEADDWITAFFSSQIISSFVAVECAERNPHGCLFTFLAAVRTS